MATTRTELELATNVPLHFNIIAAEESPSASDSTYVIGRYRDLFNEMTLNDETYWSIGQVPAEIFEPLTQMVALTVEKAFGKAPPCRLLTTPAAWTKGCASCGGGCAERSTCARPKCQPMRMISDGHRSSRASVRIKPGPVQPGWLGATHQLLSLTHWRGGKVKNAIYSSDGLQGFALLQGVAAGQGCRAGIVVEGALYVVAGVSLYKVTTTGVQTLIGSMNISKTAPVFMERNRRAVPDIAIVCDGLMFYCRGDVLAQVTDPDLFAPITLAFSDGYFGITTAQNKWQIGAIDDASAWDGLDFATADGDPDALIRIAALQAQFYLFGEKTIEVWQDSGGADFPYARSFVIPIGLLASNSVATVAETFAWVAHDRTVRLLGSGDSAQVISTPKVESDIQEVEDPSTIRAASWSSRGHTFYALTCPQWTHVYDTRMQRWHERQTYGRGIGVLPSLFRSARN